MNDELSPFKRLVESDIKDVFINFDEFADWHDINDEPILCVIDTDLVEKYGDKADSYRFGVMTNQVRIFVKASDMVPAPVQDQLLVIDGSHHRVDSVSSEMGVLVILATEVNE